MSEQLMKNGIDKHLKNNFQDAFAIYKQIIDNQPMNHHAHHLLGLLLVQNGFTEEGQVYLERALSIKPDYEEARHNQKVIKDPAFGRHQLEQQNIAREKSTERDAAYPTRIVGNVDDWRHMRMLSFVKFLAKDSECWLTLGDHFGHDSQRIISHGITQCTPSSLSTEYLEAGKSNRHIENFLKINAEEIPLNDNCYDVVVCKEALHHMSRPYQAIYEMLRVARKAVIVIEPNDTLIDWRPEGRSSVIKREFLLDERVGPMVSYASLSNETIVNRYIDWWEDGPNNYVYTLSEREITKIASGYGVPSFGVFSFNDYYSAEFSLDEAKLGSKGYDKTIEQIRLHDQLCEQTGIPKSYVVGIFFKQTPPQETRENLTSYGFNIQLTRTRFLPFAWPNSY